MLQAFAMANCPPLGVTPQEISQRWNSCRFGETGDPEPKTWFSQVPRGPGAAGRR